MHEEVNRSKEVIEYLLEKEVNPQKKGFRLLLDCILFWEDTQIENILDRVNKNIGNLYVDLAIFNDDTIVGVQKKMWDALPMRESPLNHVVLSQFIINGIDSKQKMRRNENVRSFYFSKEKRRTLKRL